MAFITPKEQACETMKKKKRNNFSKIASYYYSRSTNLLAKQKKKHGKYQHIKFEQLISLFF